MKNKWIWVLVVVAIIIVLACWWFLLRKNADTKTYTIKEWNNFSQKVEISIDDDSILKVDKLTERDNNSSKVVTGGQYTIFKITGLEKGFTKAVVTIYNSDDTVEKQTVYEFEVLEDLSVKFLNESSVTNLD